LSTNSLTALPQHTALLHSHQADACKELNARQALLEAARRDKAAVVRAAKEEEKEQSRRELLCYQQENAKAYDGFQEQIKQAEAAKAEVWDPG
jgi:hypothetical protein